MRSFTIAFGRVLSITLLAFTPDIASAQSATYRPLGTARSPWQTALILWDASRRAMSSNETPVTEQFSRPDLAGLRPRHLELLQDALLRKHPRLVKNSSRRAIAHITRLYQTVGGRNLLHGAMAESLFLDRNPEWQYVQKPNASQHDVYRWRLGRRTPETGQVKFHSNLNPARYAEDMRRDWRAHQFFIPDDHVEPVRQYLEAKAKTATASGNQLEAHRLWRDRSRLRPAGFTSRRIVSDTRKGYASGARERYAVYSALGVSVVLSLGPELVDWAGGNVPNNVAVYRICRATSLMASGVATDGTLRLIRKGALRGTVRGNAVVATAVLVTELTWLFYEHGWQQSIYRPEFYDAVVGTVSATALGFTVAAAVSPFVIELPGGPLVVIAAGVAGGTVGYYGGRTAARAILDIVNPKILQQQERERIASLRGAFDRSLSRLRQWPN